MAKTMKNNTAQVHAVGRRKKAVARVYMIPGKGEIMINDTKLEEYIPVEILRLLIKSPMEITQTLGKYDVKVNVRGGGYSGQAGAIRHGISRALLQEDKDFKKLLRDAGFLTRDPRMKERKKYGLKKARKAPQYSKR